VQKIADFGFFCGENPVTVAASCVKLTAYLNGINLSFKNIVLASGAC